MLTDFFEDFIRLTRLRQPDGPGQVQDVWTDGAPFRGGVTALTGVETTSAGAPALRTVPMLLHESAVSLAQGERIRRVRDGAVFRVCGASDNMRAPCCASMHFSQVPVERLVSAP